MPLHTLVRPDVFQFPKFIMPPAPLFMSSFKFDCCAGKWGGRALIWSIWQFLGCKYFYHGRFQATNVLPLNRELGRDVCTQLAIAGGCLPAPTYHRAKSCKFFGFQLTCPFPWEGFLDHAIWFYCSLILACSHTYHIILQSPHFSHSVARLWTLTGRDCVLFTIISPELPCLTHVRIDLYILSHISLVFL